jgi:diguanylate cyclase (GGDEF)-like protein
LLFEGFVHVLSSPAVTLLLAAAAATASFAAWFFHRRFKRLEDALRGSQSEGQLLGESLDTRTIVARACEAAERIAPVSRFTLFVVDETHRVGQVWASRAGAGGTLEPPEIESDNPYLGSPVLADRVHDLAAAETDRSLAPKDLVFDGRLRRHLRLPLLSGDRLVAHAELTFAEPVGADRLAQVRLWTQRLTASLHAARNWKLAVTDPLSGLAGRRYFDLRLEEEWSRSVRYETLLAVAVFDLDHFKDVNDRFGHAAGDAAIRAFASVLAAEVRTVDLAARRGGEEFALLLPETDVGAAAAVADRVRQSLAASPVPFEGSEVALRVSAGVAARSASDRRPADLLARADAALYAAKETGRNRVEVASEHPGRPDAGIPARVRRARRKRDSSRGTEEA